MKNSKQERSTTRTTAYDPSLDCKPNDTTSDIGISSSSQAKKTSQSAKKREVANEIDNELKSLRITLGENAVAIAMCERILTILYNLETLKVDGLDVSSEVIDDGELDHLPARLAAEKYAMLSAEIYNAHARE
ncbi:MAG: hypothetical protein LBE09_02540 [Christensenellaceae bacterium]|nr:hypothetical protein [Christensenellaceae bacterium]